jgi:hypothetical protein
MEKATFPPSNTSKPQDLLHPLSQPMLLPLPLLPQRMAALRTMDLSHIDMEEAGTVEDAVDSEAASIGVNIEAGLEVAVEGSGVVKGVEGSVKVVKDAGTSAVVKEVNVVASVAVKEKDVVVSEAKEEKDVVVSEAKEEKDVVVSEVKEGRDVVASAVVSEGSVESVVVCRPSQPFISSAD